jgi:colanic acid/amylovoran biosynthesis glycosyltransferase
VVSSRFFEGAARQTDARHLVCVGRLCEQKGQLLLIEAVRRLVQRGTNLTLTLAGDGELRPTLEAMIKDYNLEKKVHITGWISNDDVRDNILAARALVLPSFAEGLPVVIMEAMALRRPVISTFIAGIPELVSNGEHGWLVPAGDVEALMKSMQECLDASSETLRKMGVVACEKVVQSHNADAEAAMLAELFRDSVDKAPDVYQASYM